MLVTLYRGLQLVLRKTIKIGDTKYCFCCVLPSSQIQAHLLTSSSRLKPPPPYKTGQYFGDRHLLDEDYLMGTWKYDNPCSWPSTF